MGRTKSRLVATINPGQVESESLNSFLEFWKGKRRDSETPRREDFLPEEMKSHLGDLLIACPLEGYVDFRYRLVGTNITAVSGQDYTGMTVKQVFAVCGEQEAEEAVRAYSIVSRKQVSLRVSGGLLWANKSYIKFDALLLPIRPPRGDECWIIGKMVASASEERRR